MYDLAKGQAFRIRLVGGGVVSVSTSGRECARARARACVCVSEWVGGWVCEWVGVCV